ncbi:MAG: tRNA (adenosine(37)-N6)-threonylcarbamoyltransferase complex transferase subunit TsaD [Dehalococcoidia bacterium]
MILLGIETSCDESAAAIVEDGHRIRANVVATQADIHSRYGGVVPEVASRQHLRTILPVIETALQRAELGFGDLDGVAVTHGPGLAGSLLVGVNAAKAVAYAQNLPLLGLNHLEGHVYANWLDDPDDRPPPRFPALCLVVSGGHTDLIIMQDHNTYRRLGKTRDDAAGEAFDKVSRLLGLGYPGGPAIERVANGVKVPASITLPRAWLRGTHDFSFSGLKTAVLHLVRGPDAPPAPEVAAAFQDAVVDVLAEKTARAAREYGVVEVMLSGGVAANSALRRALAERCSQPLRVPLPRYCTDNAAMIGACGYFHFLRGERSGWDLDVTPNLPFAA